MSDRADNCFWVCEECAGPDGYKEPCFLFVPEGSNVNPNRCPFADDHARFKNIDAKVIIGDGDDEGLQAFLKEIKNTDGKEKQTDEIGKFCLVTDEEWERMAEKELEEGKDDR
jgi:hypothetical protein